MAPKKVFLADYFGFCYGVKKAVDLALTTKDNTPDRSVYTLGPIIHNPQMVAHLAEKGIEVAKNICDIPPKGTVIIRSHGVGPEIYKKAKELGLNIVDATCPHVKKAQKSAFELMSAGYQVVIIGEAHHPEVKSILKWANDQAIIIETPADAQKLCRQEKLGIVAQTTFSSENFQKILAVLHDKCDNLEVKRTICTSTDKRQEAALALVGKVDVMVVVGGKNSANTARLVQTCSNAGRPTFYIETAQEINPGWFATIDSVGITAGASTPDWIIREVYKEIMEIMGIVENTENAADKKAIEDEEINLTGKTSNDMAEHLRNNEFVGIEADTIISGKVIKVNRNEVFVDIGYKAEGVISLNELAFPVPEDASDVVSVGDIISVYVLEAENNEGNVKLSKLKAATIEAWDKLEKALSEKIPLEAVVHSVVKGGLRASVFGVIGFIPASLFDLRYVEDLSLYVGQQLKTLPIEVDRDKSKLVLSRKELLLKERELKEQETLSKLEEGQIIKGKVSRTAPFGAFVDLGGIDGLIHISDLSWQKVSSVEEVVRAGDEVSVFVLKVDPQSKKISLSLKETVQDPWFDKIEELTVNSTFAGKIVKISNFGVFVELSNGIDGLVHISEISDKHINKPQEAVTLGQEVDVKVLRIDKENKRIALSISKAHADKERNEYQNYISKEAQNNFQDNVNSVTLGDKFPDLFLKLKK